MLDYFNPALRRAYEVSMAGGFYLNIIDLTPNHFYKGVVGDIVYCKVLRDYPEYAKGFEMFIVEEENPSFNYLDLKMWEDVSELKQRAKVAREKKSEGWTNHSDIFYRMQDSTPDGMRMIRKAYDVFDATHIEMVNFFHLAYTIQLLDKSDILTSSHVAEAISYAIVRDDPDGER